MGLFDDIKCNYALPGDPPEDGMFQTKDLACDMSSYIITEEGRLLNGDGSAASEFSTCTFDMYFCNIVISGPGIYTAKGEDAHSGEYRMVFVNGRLQSATQTENEREPALPSREHRPSWTPPTTQEIAQIEFREAESLIGREMFLQYGGGSPGESVKVVAENARYYVVEGPNEEIHKLYRSDRDCLLFDTPEDAQGYRDQRKRKWADEKAEYDRKLAARADKQGGS